MATVVLLRGANLGKRRFSPKAVEAALADLDVANVGAAGTFVVRKRVARATLRARVEAELPFDPAPMILVSGEEVQAALRAGEAIDAPEGAKRFATAMDAPRRATLPVEAPPGRAWGVRVLAVEGPFALGLRRRVDETGVYPNEVVEKAFACEATTRDWPTLEKLGRILAEPA